MRFPFNQRYKKDNSSKKKKEDWRKTVTSVPGWRLLGITSSTSLHSTEARHSSFSAAGVWLRLQSIPSYSTRTPTEMDDVAGSGSGVMIGSGIGSGADIAEASVSVSMVGSGILSLGVLDGLQIQSGAGIGLVRDADGTDPLFASTYFMKAAKFPQGPFTGMRALDHSLRLVWKNTQSEQSR